MTTVKSPNVTDGAGGGTAGSNARVWVVRAGKHGQDEPVALESGLAIIGFREIGDLATFASAKDLVAALRKADPEANQARAVNFSRQLLAFRDGLQVGDVVALPLKTRPGQIALGRVRGPYRFLAVNGEARHTRAVEWVQPDVPRTAFRQDLLHSFGAFLTVCRITRHDAEARVQVVLSGKPDPGFGEAVTESRVVPGELLAEDARLDVAQAARDEVTAFVRRRFPGHEMARLVEAVLQADGFVTHRSPPGPDGGADILAARGPLGLDTPTLCVQVKATEATADVNVFRGLQGSMASFKATQGLLVCWSGFTTAVKNEARQHTFSIRLWDQSDLVDALYRCYDRVSAEIQAELPLTRVWALVHEDLDDDT
jgi:restriction system protein